MKIRKSKELDDITAERLLDGTLGSDDVAPEFAGLARLFEAARAVDIDGATPDGLIEKMSALVESSTTKTARDFAMKGGLIMPRLRRLKLTAAGVGAVLALMTGLAFAGALPEQVQNAADKAFDFFGFESVPAGTLADEASERGDNRNGEAGTSVERRGEVSGSEVSQDAQNAETFTDYTGLADEVSGGHSVTGTSTAEQRVPEDPQSSGQEGQETAEENQSTGEEAASDGADNSDGRRPR